MSSAEIRRLDRRVDGLDDSLRAIGDSIVDIHGALDEHTATLERHGTVLDQHTATLERHGTVLDQHTATLERHGTVLDQHTATLAGMQGQMASMQAQLAEVLRRLPDPG